MRTIIDLSSARTFELNPRSPPPRPCFLPFSLSPSPPRKSPYFTMQREATLKATPRTRGTPAPISDFFKGSPATTPKPRPRSVSMVVDEFDDIEEISETDYTEEELRKSAKRRSDRELKRLSSNAPSSSHAAPSSMQTLSDALEPEHIDLVGSSSPVRRSPSKHPALSSSATTSTTKPSSARTSLSNPSSGRTRSPSPPIRRTRRRIVASEDVDDDDDVPLLRPTSKRISSSKPSRLSKDLVQDTDVDDEEPAPVVRKGKGKGRADPDEEDYGDLNDDITFIAPAGADSPNNYDDGWDDDMADMTDFGNLHYEPIDIPDFEMLPSTQARRSRTPTPSIYVSDDESPQAKRGQLSGAAARAAALSASSSPPRKEFGGLTLISELSPHLQEFYLNHFRRGANEEDSDDDPDAFGVAAVVPKRAPARGRGRGRGGWRGRGAKRGGYARRNK
ncbi:hypothetical protein CspHIS471_0304950 [Cutaneotrichosporon sp. HIS471]|nr:hypothetical protein CspHIS471_0304950 [Cutaneotrichosporon sp. HIS471]